MDRNHGRATIVSILIRLELYRGVPNLRKSKLRRRQGTGPSGHRNEYLRALVGKFGDATADRVMTGYDEFATLFVNIDLPPWFYAAEALARLVPLVKARVSEGAEPDARPVAIGEVEARAISRHLTDSACDAAASVFAPQQLAVGVKGGISSLVHGLRLSVDQRGDFVIVKLDLRNAYNAISRAAVIRRLTAHPSLAFLVPLLRV